MMGQRQILGRLPIVSLNSADWVEYYLAHLRARHLQRAGLAGDAPPQPPPYFTSANGHVLSRAARDREFRAWLAEADGIDADGMSLVLASRLLHQVPLPERCATTDLFHLIATAAEDHAMSFYLLGGTEDINARAAETVQRLYPELLLAGRHHGFFSASEEEEIVRNINDACPDILWVGLGVPREQAFAVSNRARLAQVGLIKTCGGLFDFLAGANARAPEILQRVGMEWLFRLVLEPRRLLWRYIVTNPHALWLLLTASMAPLDMGYVSVPGEDASHLDDRILSL